jgi:hypothetical protein
MPASSGASPRRSSKHNRTMTTALLETVTIPTANQNNLKDTTNEYE